MISALANKKSPLPFGKSIKLTLPKQKTAYRNRSPTD
jgi:hypothetical protein